ncbi:glycoside hydrolase family 75 protein [Aspergillus stella-maris]|uniref:glycoside hydrolase family 75 protein n=1 Tax=Aspergillus stella-maris TaxID=1810926 RepID=UPI003CCD85D6
MSFISRTRFCATVYFATLGVSQIVDGPEFNHAHGGPPASYFTAAASIPVAALRSAASHLGGVSGDGVYLMNSESSSESAIYEDWASFNQGAAIVWTADMDVDCDGIDEHCRGNEDGLPETNWGALSAYEVPWVVIPDEYLTANQDILPGNNVAAVICNGRMFYNIVGDSNGDDPQLTGEASWLMARTCFPHEHLNGGSGHENFDVTYIVFLGQQAVLPNTAMNDHYVTDFGMLRAMGDRLVSTLLANIGLISGAPTRTVVSTTFGTPLSTGYLSSSIPSPTTLVPPLSSPTTPLISTSTSTPSPSDCSWPGHCQGVICSLDDDCSDDLACIGGICAVDLELEDWDTDEEEYDAGWYLFM